MIGSKLKELRLLVDKTQAEVAKDLGISQKGYANYENNNREPNFELLKKIAKYYGVSVGYLFGESFTQSLIDNTIKNLIDENLITKQQSFEDLDNTTKQMLICAIDKHIDKLFKYK